MFVDLTDSLSVFVWHAHHRFLDVAEQRLLQVPLAVLCAFVRCLQLLARVLYFR